MTVAAKLDLDFERGDHEFVEFVIENADGTPDAQAFIGSTFTLHLFGLTGGDVTLSAQPAGALVRFELPPAITSRLPTDGQPAAEYKFRRLIGGQPESLVYGALRGRGRNVSL